MLPLFVLLTVLASIHGAPNVDSKLPDAGFRILKGENASLEDFPFMVSLRKIRTYRHYCTGTILTSNWVMTAGHCCMRDWRSSFSTGTVIRSGSVYYNGGGMNHTVVRVHPNMNYSSYRHVINDICLMRVLNPFKFGKDVQQVLLPNKDFVVDSGDKLTAVGWGWIGLGVQPKQLMKLTNLIGLTNAECGVDTGISIDNGTICARAQLFGQGVCFGDSGGALLSGDVQVGVTSHIMLPCGNPAPDFFTRVSYFIDWIVEKLGPEATELKFYESV